MKTIDKNSLEKLLEIIKPSPMLCIAHLCDNEKLICDTVNNFCLDNKYEYLLNCTHETFYQQAMSMYGKNEWVKIKQFDFVRPSYMSHGKFYDYFFVTCDIQSDTKDQFLQKSYKVIKNAGHIIIFIPKKNSEEIDIWTELLEKNYFVATNTIDMFDDYNVIISKKMHGWGR